MSNNLKFENTKVFGMENALLGMRLPMNSDGDSEDVTFKCDNCECYQSGYCIYPDYGNEYGGEGCCGISSPIQSEMIELGEKDKSLALRLAKAGQDHGKFLRMVHVQVQITAPMYWVAEHDTYKVATTRNSSSFMHTGMKDRFDVSQFVTNCDFTNKMADEELDSDDYLSFVWCYMEKTLNNLRNAYDEAKDPDKKEKLFLQIRSLLPQGWKITYMWDADYATLRNIYFQRRNHRLPEWHEFCEWIESLPYSELITAED